MAVAYLGEGGYTILNGIILTSRLKLISHRKAGTIGLSVVVEVKTRNGAVFGNPQEFVSKSKVNSR